MARIDAFFKLMSEQKASDLHLSTSNPPMLRINGDLIRVDYPPLTNDELQSMVYEIAPEMKIKVFEETGDVDFGYEIPWRRALPRQLSSTRNTASPPCSGSSRARCSPATTSGCHRCSNASRLLKKGSSARHRPDRLRQIDHARGDDRLRQSSTGRTTSSRWKTPLSSSTRASNPWSTTAKWAYTRSHFAAALRGALREDPDIILVGEMRDLETIELALTAAATGHLVFGTLHTSSAAKTVDRVIDVFPTSQQNQVRATLAESLKGVVAQNLFRRIDKPGRVAALEILVFDSAIANLVREGKTHQIPGMIQVGKKKGNQPLDDAIMDHLRNLRISPEEAYEKANDKKKFRPFLTSPPDDFED